MANDNMRAWRYGSRTVVATDLDGGFSPTANLFTPAYLDVGSGGTVADGTAKFLLPKGGLFKVKQVIVMGVEALEAGQTATLQLGTALDADGVLEIDLTPANTAQGIESVFIPVQAETGPGALANYVFSASNGNLPFLRLHTKGGTAPGNVWVMAEMEAVGGTLHESALGV